MKYIRIIGFIVAISLIMFKGLSFAQTGTETIPPTTIELNVSADKDLKYLIQSYMKRELKSLGNVKIYDPTSTTGMSNYFYDYDPVFAPTYIPDWEIGIIAAEPSTKKDYKLGYIVMSVVILRNYETRLPFVNLSAMEGFKLDHRLFSKVAMHQLFFISSNDLQRKCSEIVAELDIKYSPVTTQEDIEKIRGAITTIDRTAYSIADLFGLTSKRELRRRPEPTKGRSIYQYFEKDKEQEQ